MTAAPIDFLAPIDMNGNEILTLILQTLAVDPVTPGEARVWYNSTDETLNFATSSGVVSLPQAPGAIDADTLEGQAGAYYLDRANHTGSQAQATITGLVAALAALAPLASPAFTGNPTAPTAAPGDNDASVANTAFVTAAIAALVDSAPGTLDTLNELAAALGDDPNFAATLVTTLSTKTDSYSETIGDGVETDIVITHGLGTRDAIVSVRDAATNQVAHATVEMTSVDTVTVSFATAPASNAFRVTVVG